MFVVIDIELIGICFIDRNVLFRRSAVQSAFAGVRRDTVITEMTANNVICFFIRILSLIA